MTNLWQNKTIIKGVRKTVMCPICVRYTHKCPYIGHPSAKKNTLLVNEDLSETSIAHIGKDLNRDCQIVKIHTNC